MALSTCVVVPAASVVIMLPPDAAVVTYGAPLTTVTTKVALTVEPFNGEDYNPPERTTA